MELITRVYLAKSIVHRKVTSDNSSITAGESQSNEASKSGTTKHEKPSAGEMLTHEGGDRDEIGFNETFSKPLVFGYRALTLIPR